MFLTGKTILGLSALISASFVAAFALLDASAQARTPSLKIEERHPDLSGLPASTMVLAGETTTVATKRADRLAEAGECAAQTWPYVSQDCATSRVRQPVRTITIEQRVGESTSVLLRVPGQVARN